MVKVFAAQLIASVFFAAQVFGMAMAQDPHAGHNMGMGGEHVGYVPNSVLEAATSLKSDIGLLHDPATTSSADAQKFYDQGEAYLHSYVWIEAARSFNQALRLDPKLALAYVGLSRVYTGLQDAEAAKKAEDKAIALKKDVSPREQRRIDLRAKPLRQGRKNQDGDQPHKRPCHAYSLSL